MTPSTLRTVRNVALAVLLAALLPFGLQAGLAVAQSGGDGPSESESPTDSGSPSDDQGGAFEGTHRVSGPDRIATAVAISQYEFPNGADEAYFARADNFVDAVAAGSLTRGPVLLVPDCGTLPQVVAAELLRLRPHRVVALGGTAAICDDLLTQAAALLDDASPSPTPSPSGSPTPTGSPTPSPSPSGTEQTVDLAVGQQQTFPVRDAGSVRIERTAGGVSYVSHTATAGWTVTVDQASPEVEVDFVNGATHLRFNAEVEDGGLVRIRVEDRST